MPIRSPSPTARKTARADELDEPAAEFVGEIVVVIAFSGRPAVGNARSEHAPHPNHTGNHYSPRPFWTTGKNCGSMVLVDACQIPMPSTRGF
jgi:hypothetical protein